MLEYSLTCENLLFRLNLLAEVRNGLHLINAVEEIADVLDDLLLLFVQLHLPLESIEGCIDLRIVSDRALVFICVYVEEGLGVLWEADGGDRFGARGDPVVLQDLLLALHCV